MLKRFIEGQKRAIAWEYMKQASRRHAADYPQMVCYSFDHIAQHINFDGRYEQRELKYVLENFSSHIAGKTVLDIGANIGNHTVAFAAMAKQVFSFEPHPRNYQLLTINSSFYSNVKTFNFGASDKNQVLPAMTPKGNMGATSITFEAISTHNESDVVNFSLAALDELPSIVDQEIGFVKIDVEGHELSALRGMQRILEKQKPLIALEQHADEILDGTSPVIDFLKKIGYQYFYELSQPADWRTPGSLPAPIRVPLKLAENLIFGAPTDVPNLARVNNLDKRSYFMLFASASPLA